MTAHSRRTRRALFFVYLVFALGAAILAVPIAGALEPTLMAQGNASSGSSSKPSANPEAQKQDAQKQSPARQASAGTSAPAVQPPQQSFEDVDRNKDGVLDKSEAAGVPGLSAYFERVDKNRDGKLDKDEFEQALSVINLQK